MVDSNGLGNNYDWTKGDDKRKREARSLKEIKAKVASTVAFLLEHNRPDLAAIVAQTGEPPVDALLATDITDILRFRGVEVEDHIREIGEEAANIITDLRADNVECMLTLSKVHMIVGTVDMCADWCGKSPTKDDDGWCGWCKLQAILDND